ncbi:SHOCT domain-containing protein [uncultured Desulfuromusa sp.]|uniref:SHOCT domain-containing protein n=1 Tax=uncultured Desulfuromusa sp. TaxID=219183 RepID=UPI002AA7425B|nr:SHOCT domain-containing protein [uncultured Desulfuromusa sp.]
MKLNDEQNKSIFNGVIFGYLVLLLHVLLIIGLGITVVVIKGIYDFRWLIILAGLTLIGASAYYFYHYFKAHKQKLNDLMSNPAFNDRTLEISLMGGMATMKLGHKDDNIQLIEASNEPEVKQLESADSNQIEELTKLNRMLDDGLITREEFLRLKQQII